MAVESDVTEIHDGEDEGGESNEDGPEGEEEVGQGSVDDCRIASYVFQDIKPVSLNDDGKDHVQDWKTQSNEQVDHESTAFLRGRLDDGRLPDHEINPSLEGQVGGGDPNDSRDRNPRGDITPYRGPIDDIAIPHDRIDEPDERRKAAPEDEKTRASVPCRGFGQVPSERDRGGGEGKERKDGECVVGSRHFGKKCPEEGRRGLYASCVVDGGGKWG